MAAFVQFLTPLFGIYVKLSVGVLSVVEFISNDSVTSFANPRMLRDR